MDSSGSELHLLDYWPTLVRRRWVVFLALIACTLVAIGGSLMVEPRYKATATLQIERQSPDILTFRDLSRMDYSWAAYSEFYQTQYRILASQPVARRAVERMSLSAHPLFETSEGTPGLAARLRSLIPRREARAVEVDPEAAAAERLLANLEVMPVRDSHLVEISWVSVDPELAADVANAVTQAYIRYTIDSRYTATEEAGAFLTEQIAELKGEIRTTEDQLQKYGREKRIITIDESSNITLQALKDIAERKTVAETVLAQKLARYNAVLEAQPEAIPEVMSSHLITRLREEYAATEVGYFEISKRFKDDWPDVRTLRSKLELAGERLNLESERIASQVRAAAQADYQAARQEVENLDRLQREREGAAQRLKGDAVEYANLRSEAEKKRETLDILLTRKDEMALSTRLRDLDVSSLNVHVMQEASAPVAPFRPRTKRNALIGLALGLALGVGMAFFLDYVDNTITSVAELERIASFPVLAVVPRHGATTRLRRRQPMVAAESIDLVAHRDGRAGATEAHRELRTSLLLSNPGRPPQQIMITSALPEEGKTATALNLAVVLAQLGRRVLLIDTDLRRPRLHKAFGLDNGRGVSTYLSGLEDSPVGLIVPTHVPGLDLLPSGPIPPNPSELLNSDIFAHMGDALVRNGYDHVLFDSPPLLSVSDPVIIASNVEIGIVVVRAGKTPRQSVRAAAEKLRQAGEGPFGFVLNDLDPDSHGAVYYHEYYGRYGEAEEVAAKPDAAKSEDDERVRGTGA